jgi:hypothetical protein
MFDVEEIHKNVATTANFMLFKMKETGTSKSFLKGFLEECERNRDILIVLPKNSKENYTFLCLVEYLIPQLEILIKEQKKVHPDPVRRMM